jgi:small-conductance mechanosensitive channel
MQIDQNLRYVLLAVGIFVIAWLVAKFLRFLLGRFLKVSTAKINVDATKYNFLKNAISFIVFIVALVVIFFVIPPLKAIGMTLFAGAGILTAIIAFTSQHAFANIVSGIFIVIFQPIRVGDLIRIGTDFFGTVEDITLRHTVIRNFENRRIIVPNSVISNETIVNSSIEDARICNWVDFGISYDSDIDKAREIITKHACEHPLIIDNRSDEEKEEGKPMVTVRVLSLGEYSVNLRAWVWTLDNGDGFQLKTDLYEQVKKAFDREGVEIPFPYRSIVMKNPRKNE